MNNTIKHQDRFRMNQQIANSESFTYYPSGNVKQLFSHGDNGELSGRYQLYYDSSFSTVRVSGSFKKGKADGIWVFYHAAGSVKERGLFRNGNRVGCWRRWNVDDIEQPNILYPDVDRDYVTL
jgi:antitoxin component YwqK of YwqJK toxin-antitoxin module